jgi:hypothetical protein
VFEDLRYRVEEATSLDVDGGEIAGTVFLTDEEAAGGHYDELTAMKRPICRENTACPGVYRRPSHRFRRHADSAR